MNIVHRDQVEEFVVGSVEGQAMPGRVTARKFLHGQHGLLLEVRVPKGMITPEHVHGHDSLLYILSGRIRTRVGNEEGEAGPGDAVLHPAGVSHVAEALEDTAWIEVKAPAEETW